MIRNDTNGFKYYLVHSSKAQQAGSLLKVCFSAIELYFDLIVLQFQNLSESYGAFWEKKNIWMPDQ